MKKIKKLEVIFIGIAVSFIIAEGFTLFVVWNILPVALYYLLLKNGLPFWNKRRIKTTLLITGFLLLFLPVYTHLDWVMNSHGSTAGLTFLFIPLWGILFSIVPAILQINYVSRLKNESKNF